MMKRIHYNLLVPPSCLPFAARRHTMPFRIGLLDCHWHSSSAILILLTVMLTPLNSSQGQSYNQNTGYLIQKVGPFTSYFYIPLKHGLVAPYFYGYYVASEETLLNFFENDSVDNDQAIMLCDPASIMFADSAITEDVRKYTRIKDILLLDDSEIYKIGRGIYIIRKIRYAYYDNAAVKVYVRGCNYLMWNDISDEDTAEFNASYEVGQVYGREYYQCYHHLIEMLPTPPQIQRYLWRRVYQIGEKRELGEDKKTQH